MQREADGSPRIYWRALTRRLSVALSLLAAALMPTAAGAEVLDELVVIAEHADAVIRVSFGLRIQYLRHEIFGDSLVEIYFRPLTLDGAPVTESRRIAAGPSFPGVEAVWPAAEKHNVCASRWSSRGSGGAA